MRLSILAAALGTALPAQAFDIDAMTEAERQSFREEVRAYLLENPDVLMEAMAVLEERREVAAANADALMLQENKGEIFDDGWSYVGGNPDGDVTIVEFLDYRCGFCKRAFPAVEELVASDGNIRLIVKEFPILGPASDLAARYAMATKRIEGDDAYKSVHDTMMGLKADLNERTLAMLSAEFDLNHEAIMAEMETDAVRDAIAANRALGARLSINGTPSFIMGENFVRGFVELEQMRAIVEDIRAEQS